MKVMKSNLTIDFCRGSIFAPTVAYNESVWKKLCLNFEGYLPTQRNSQAIDLQGNLIQVGSQTWTLSSKADKVDINFLDGKIDVIISGNGQLYTYESIQILSERIFSIFEKIIDSFNLTSTRIAFAPSLILHQDIPDEIKGFARSIFRDKKFKGENIDNCDFCNVFRVKTIILEKEYIVNYLANFAQAQTPVMQQNLLKMQNILSVNMDINTLGNANYVFNLNHVKEFFKLSPSMVEDFLGFYFKEN
ncbi:MAG: hypothetical protein IJ665_06115 [Phocaeicola sp.]|nr:hypothetical protein [Phocaeicola sp.]